MIDIHLVWLRYVSGKKEGERERGREGERERGREGERERGREGERERGREGEREKGRGRGSGKMIVFACLLLRW